jgi:2-oxo-4-hydroxy-4-carboxy-5-ureidoimidazoline decarboxylase
MTLKEFNSLAPGVVESELFRCCGCTRWVKKLMEGFPFKSLNDLKKYSDEQWSNCTNSDFLEAFSHHPRIGDKAKSEKLSATKDWAEEEQSGVDRNDLSILEQLAEANIAYEKKFGFIFIVCATGKTSEEMLAIIRQRMKNDIETEINAAAAEQNKITHLRIDKLFS